MEEPHLPVSLMPFPVDHIPCGGINCLGPEHRCLSKLWGCQRLCCVVIKWRPFFPTSWETDQPQHHWISTNPALLTSSVPHSAKLRPSRRSRQNQGQTELRDSMVWAIFLLHAQLMQRPTFTWLNLYPCGPDKHCWHHPDDSLRPCLTTKVCEHLEDGNWPWCALGLLLNDLIHSTGPSLNLYQSSENHFTLPGDSLKIYLLWLTYCQSLF